MKFTTTAALTTWLAMANATLSAQAPDSWRAVERLPLGAVIAVTDESGAIIRGRLLRADDTSIFLYAPTVDARQLKPIDEIISRDPRLLSHVDGSPTLLADSDIDIEHDAISRKGRRIAAFDEVFYLAAPSRVVSVVQPKDLRRSVGPILLGAVIGAGVGLGSAIHIALNDTPCGKGCDGRAIGAGVALAGATLLGGALGDTIGRPKEDLVIYARR